MGTPRLSALNTNPETLEPSFSLLTSTHCYTHTPTLGLRCWSATQSIAHKIDLEGWCVGERRLISLRRGRGEKEVEEKTWLESWGLCSDGVCMHDGQAVAFTGRHIYILFIGIRTRVDRSTILRALPLPAVYTNSVVQFAGALYSQSAAAASPYQIELRCDVGHLRFTR